MSSEDARSGDPERPAPPPHETPATPFAPERPEALVLPDDRDAPDADIPPDDGEAPQAPGPTTATEGLGQARRLHPAGIAVLAVGALRGAALPLVAVFVAGVAGGGLDTEALVRGIGLAAVAAVFAAVMGIVAWATTTWRIDDATLHHRRGLLSVKETDVPLTRVQALDTVRGPIQRLFGVVGVHVQTAGGGREGEIVLPALAAEDVEALRDAVGAGGRAPSVRDGAPAEATVAQRRLDRRGLMVAAVTAGQLGVLVPALAAVPQLVESLTDGDIEDAGRFGAGLVPDGAAGWVLLIGALVLIGWLLTVAGTVVAFAGFAVRREPDRLRIRRGWVARREASIPVARIQAVRVVEGVLRVPFGLAALRIEVAGYKAEPPAAQTLFPLLQRSEVRSFLAEFLPELADEPDGLVPLPRRSARRYVLPPALIGLLLGAPVALFVPGAGPWPLLAALVGAAIGRLGYRAAGWRLENDRLAIRSRRLARVTILTPTTRLQEHGIRQTLLQRRARLADLEVRVGAATHGRVRHLDQPTAQRLFDALRRQPEPVDTGQQ